MTVFGIGTMELILILLLLILIFGPERISEMGRWLGQSYRRLTGITSEVNQQVMQVRKAVDQTLQVPDLTQPIREATQEINTIHKDLSRELDKSAAAVAEVDLALKADLAGEKEEEE